MEPVQIAAMAPLAHPGPLVAHGVRANRHHNVFNYFRRIGRKRPFIGPIRPPGVPVVDAVQDNNMFRLLEDEAALPGEVLTDEKRIEIGQKRATESAETRLKDVNKGRKMRDNLAGHNYCEQEIPKRKDVNKFVKNKKHYMVYSRLLYHLRCKHFMKARDAGLINALVTDARVWMAKAEFVMETAAEYTILAYAVLGAFLVSREELEFRQIIKQKDNYDNMTHINNTAGGVLGNYLFGPKSGTPFLGSLMSRVELPGKIKP